MARPERNTVDYYPHIVGEGKKMFFIENKYGNDGYATWHKLLEKLSLTDFHYLNLNKEEEVMFLASKCRVSEETLLNIITDLSKIGSFDKEMWSNKIVWCQLFIDSIDDAYKKRNNDCITLEGLRELLTGLGILLTGKLPSEVPVKPQRIGKDSKLKDIVIPTIEEVRLFFYENSFSEQLADKAFKHYDLAGWKDTNGKIVKSWKQKMNTVWFKDENKIIKEESTISSQQSEKFAQELYGSDTRKVKSVFE